MSDGDGADGGETTDGRDIRQWAADHRQQLIVVAVVLGLIAVPVAADGLASVVPLTQTSGNITVANDEGYSLSVDDPDVSRINGTVLFNSSDSGDIRVVSDAGNVTFDADGPGSATVVDLAPRTTVEDINATQTPIQIAPINERSVTIGGAADRVVVRDQDLSDQDVDLTVETTGGQTNLTVPADDGTGVFALNSSDAVLDRGIASGGSVTLELPAGTHDLTLRRGAVVTVFNDSSGNRLPQSDQPVQLSVFSNERVIAERSINDNRFVVAGPGTGPFEMSVDADGFQSRTVVLETIDDDTDVFLLNQSVNRVETRFELADTTGQFPSEDTVIFVDKVLNTSGTAQYREVASGPAAPSGDLTTVLEQGEQFRIRVANGEGDRRVLGTYQATSARTVTLSVGRIQFQLANETSLLVGAERPSPDVLQFRTEAGERLFDDVSVRIHELGNPANELQSVSQTDTDNLTVTQTLTAPQQNLSWVANYSATIGGQTVDGVVRFGGAGRGSESLRIPLDQEWKERFALGGILLLGTLFSAGNLRAGTLVVPGLGGLFWLLGWLPPVTGAVSVGVAMTLGVIYAVGVRGGT